MKPAEPRLPFVDEHSVVVAACVDETWRALLRSLESGRRSASRRIGALVLGAVPAAANGAPLEEPGAELPGFEVRAVEPPKLIELRGWHHWSAYLLRYRLEPAGDEATRLTAETEAMFPGRAGALYRLLVIGSGFHVRAVMSELRSVKRRAEGAA